MSSVFGPNQKQFVVKESWFSAYKLLTLCMNRVTKPHNKIVKATIRYATFRKLFAIRNPHSFNYACNWFLPTVTATSCMVSRGVPIALSILIAYNIAPDWISASNFMGNLFSRQKSLPYSTLLPLNPSVPDLRDIQGT